MKDKVIEALLESNRMVFKIKEGFSLITIRCTVCKELINEGAKCYIGSNYSTGSFHGLNHTSPICSAYCISCHPIPYEGDL